jgi:hypothetical protein
MRMKTNLKIDWATHESSVYACRHWHYSKCIPKSKLVKIGAWENGKFIGVVIFSYGATPDLVNPYGLKMTEGCELTRIALKEHISPVSKILSIALKFLKKSNPGIRLIVSFADTNQGHHGGIYQATNWIYSGITDGCWFYKDKKGKIWHPRNVSENLSLSGKCIRPSDCKKIWKKGKYRYLMPLDEEMKRQIEKIRKPYPKRVTSKDNVASGFQSEEGGVIPTVTLQNKSEKI